MQQIHQTPLEQLNLGQLCVANRAISYLAHGHNPTRNEKNEMGGGSLVDPKVSRFLGLELGQMLMLNVF
jgi:hypothetical protein